MVPAVREVSDHEYVMRDAISRKYIEAIMASARKATNTETINVNLKQGEWRVRHNIEKIFFDDYGDDSRKYYVVSRFIAAVFARQEHTAPYQPILDSRNSSDEDAGLDSARTFSLIHKSPDRAVRRTIVDFGRCF